VSGRASGVKIVGMAEVGHRLVWMRWQSIQIVSVSACVVFILHQKIQKMAKCTFWYQLTRVGPDRVHRAVKRLCVCAIVDSSMFSFYARQRSYSAYMPWQFRPSVCLSICLSVRPSVCLSHGWISQKRLKLGSRNFHHTVAPSL